MPLSLGLAIAVATVLADSSVVVLALPDLLSSFDVSIERVAWVITAFNLALAIAAVPAAYIAVRAGAARVAAAGLACFAARLALSLAIDGSALRLGGAVTGVLVALVIRSVQRRPFRGFLYRGGEPAGLIVPGLLAVVGCGLLEAVVILGLTR